MIGTGIGLGLCGNYLPTARDIDPTVVLDLQFATTKSLTATKGPTPSFSRASTATYFDQNGILQTAAVDQPRFGFYWDALSSIWSNGGLLLERGGTNYCTYSRDLTNAAWSKTNVTVTKNQTGLDGVANSCCSITATAANGEVGFTNSSGLQLFGVFYIKRLSGNGTISYSVDGGTTWTALDNVNLFAPITSNFTPAPTTFSSGTIQGFAPGIGATFKIRLANSGDSIAIDGVNMCDERIMYPIHTNGTAVTKAAEVCQIASAGSLYSAEATYFLQFSASIYSDGSSGYRPILTFSDGTINNAYRFDSAIRGRTQLFISGATSISNAGSLFTQLQKWNYAFRLKNNDCARQEYLYRNNTYSPTTPLVYVTATGGGNSFNKLEFGFDQTFAPVLRGPIFISAIKLWNVAKTNAELTGIIAP